MPHPEDLLTLARQMVDRNPGVRVEAELRRAVSTSYYALFHLLIREATDRLVVTPGLRARVSRTFEHRYMTLVCEEYKNSEQSGPGRYEGPSGNEVPSEIVRVASAFVTLHAARQRADYDFGTPFPHDEAEGEVKRAEDAFGDWKSAQADSSADVFLAELWCRGIPKR